MVREVSHTVILPYGQLATERPTAMSDGIDRALGTKLGISRWRKSSHNLEDNGDDTLLVGVKTVLVPLPPCVSSR